MEAASRYRLVPVAASRGAGGYTELQLPVLRPPGTTFVAAGAYALLGKLKNTGAGEEWPAFSRRSPRGAATARA